MWLLEATSGNQVCALPIPLCTYSYPSASLCALSITLSVQLCSLSTLICAPHHVPLCPFPPSLCFSMPLFISLCVPLQFHDFHNPLCACLYTSRYPSLHSSVPSLYHSVPLCIPLCASMHFSMSLCAPSCLFASLKAVWLVKTPHYS